MNLVTQKLYILLLFFNQITDNVGLVSVNNVNPLLSKVLQFVDKATSNRNIFEVTLKLLESVCVCIEEVLKKKQKYSNLPTSTLHNENEEESERQLNIYKQIYNKTCIHLKRELKENIKRKHNVQDIDGLVKKRLKEINENAELYYKLLFQFLIETQNYHTYNIQRHYLYRNKFKLEKENENSIIIIVTLHPNTTESNIKESKTISKDLLNKILYSRNPIDIDIINKGEPQTIDEILKSGHVEKCHLYSIYRFLLVSKRNGKNKIFKLLSVKGTVKMYIDVVTSQDDINFLNKCCYDESVIKSCETEILNGLYDEKSATIENKNDENESYQDIISNIKLLVDQFSKKASVKDMTTNDLDDLNYGSECCLENLYTTVLSDVTTDNDNNSTFLNNRLQIQPKNQTSEKSNTELNIPTLFNISHITTTEYEISTSDNVLNTQYYFVNNLLHRNDRLADSENQTVLKKSAQNWGFDVLNTTKTFKNFAFTTNNTKYIDRNFTLDRVLHLVSENDLKHDTQNASALMINRHDSKKSFAIDETTPVSKTTATNDVITITSITTRKNNATPNNFITSSSMYTKIYNIVRDKKVNSLSSNPDPSNLKLASRLITKKKSCFNSSINIHGSTYSYENAVFTENTWTQKISPTLKIEPSLFFNTDTSHQILTKSFVNSIGSDNATTKAYECNTHSLNNTYTTIKTDTNLQSNLNKALKENLYPKHESNNLNYSIQNNNNTSPINLYVTSKFTQTNNSRLSVWKKSTPSSFTPKIENVVDHVTKSTNLNISYSEPNNTIVNRSQYSSSKENIHKATELNMNVKAFNVKQNTTEHSKLERHCISTMKNSTSAAINKLYTKNTNEVRAGLSSMVGILNNKTEYNVLLTTPKILHEEKSKTIPHNQNQITPIPLIIPLISTIYINNDDEKDIFQSKSRTSILNEKIFDSKTIGQYKYSTTKLTNQKLAISTMTKLNRDKESFNTENNKSFKEVIKHEEPVTVKTKNNSLSKDAKKFTDSVKISTDQSSLSMIDQSNDDHHDFIVNKKTNKNNLFKSQSKLNSGLRASTQIVLKYITPTSFKIKHTIPIKNKNHNKQILNLTKSFKESNANNYEIVTQDQYIVTQFINTHKPIIKLDESINITEVKINETSKKAYKHESFSTPLQNFTKKSDFIQVSERSLLHNYTNNDVLFEPSRVQQSLDQTNPTSFEKSTSPLKNNKDQLLSRKTLKPYLYKAREVDVNVEKLNLKNIYRTNQLEENFTEAYKNLSSITIRNESTQRSYLTTGDADKLVMTPPADVNNMTEKLSILISDKYIVKPKLNENSFTTQSKKLNQIFSSVAANVSPVLPSTLIDNLSFSSAHVKKNIGSDFLKTYSNIRIDTTTNYVPEASNKIYATEKNQTLNDQVTNTSDIYSKNLETPNYIKGTLQKEFVTLSLFSTDGMQATQRVNGSLKKTTRSLIDIPDTTSHSYISYEAQLPDEKKKQNTHTYITTKRKSFSKAEQYLPDTISDTQKIKYQEATKTTSLPTDLIKSATVASKNEFKSRRKTAESETSTMKIILTQEEEELSKTTTVTTYPTNITITNTFEKKNNKTNLRPNKSRDNHKQMKISTPSSSEIESVNISKDRKEMKAESSTKNNSAISTIFDDILKNKSSLLIYGNREPFPIGLRTTIKELIEPRIKYADDIDVNQTFANFHKASEVKRKEKNEMLEINKKGSTFENFTIKYINLLRSSTPKTVYFNNKYNVTKTQYHLQNHVLENEGQIDLNFRKFHNILSKSDYENLITSSFQNSTRHPQLHVEEKIQSSTKAVIQFDKDPKAINSQPVSNKTLNTNRHKKLKSKDYRIILTTLAPKLQGYIDKSENISYTKFNTVKNFSDKNQNFVTMSQTELTKYPIKSSKEIQATTKALSNYRNNEQDPTTNINNRYEINQSYNITYDGSYQNVYSKITPSYEYFFNLNTTYAHNNENKITKIYPLITPRKKALTSETLNKTNNPNIYTNLSTERISSETQHLKNASTQTDFIKNVTKYPIIFSPLFTEFNNITKKKFQKHSTQMLSSFFELLGTQTLHLSENVTKIPIYITNKEKDYIKNTIPKEKTKKEIISDSQHSSCSDKVISLTSTYADLNRQSKNNSNNQTGTENFNRQMKIYVTGARNGTKAEKKLRNDLHSLESTNTAQTLKPGHYIDAATANENLDENIAIEINYRATKKSNITNKNINKISSPLKKLNKLDSGHNIQNNKNIIGGKSLTKTSINKQNHRLTNTDKGDKIIDTMTYVNNEVSFKPLKSIEVTLSNTGEKYDHTTKITLPFSYSTKKATFVLLSTNQTNCTYFRNFTHKLSNDDTVYSVEAKLVPTKPFIDVTTPTIQTSKALDKILFNNVSLRLKQDNAEKIYTNLTNVRTKINTNNNFLRQTKVELDLTTVKIIEKKVTNNFISNVRNNAVLNVNFTNNVNIFYTQAKLNENNTEKIRTSNISAPDHTKTLRKPDLQLYKIKSPIKVTKKVKIIKYNTYKPNEDDADDKIKSQTSANYEKIHKQLEYPKYTSSTISLRRNLNTKIKQSPIAKHAFDISKKHKPKIVKNGNTEVRDETDAVHFTKINKIKGNLLDPFEKTNLYIINKPPSHTQRKVLKRIRLPNKDKDIVTMNTKDFFSRNLQRLKNVQAPRQNINVPKPITPIPKHYILRPKFDKIDVNVKPRKEYIRPKPLFVMSNNDFYRDNFKTHHRSNALSLREKVNHIRYSLPQPPSDEPEQVIERPTYPTPNTKPTLLRDRINSIRNYLHNSNFARSTQFPLNYNYIIERTTFDPPYRDPLYYFRRSGWYETLPSIITEITTTMRKPTRRQRRTIFFLSPTVPYYRYF